MAASVFVLVVAVWPARASYWAPTAAITDGIGYRSNLLDPVNGYGVDARRLLGQLLRRYDLLPPGPDGLDRARPRPLSAVAYRKRLGALLSAAAPPPGPLSQDDDRYGWRACATNDYPAALAFIADTAAAVEPAPAADALILARHRLLDLCDIDGDGQAAFVDHVLDPVRGELPPAGRIRLAYLEAIAAFYRGHFDVARAHAAAVPDQAGGWVADAARYLQVRIARGVALRDHHEDDRAAAAYVAAIAAHLDAYPGSRFALTVWNLRRHGYALIGDEARQREALIRAFERAFSARSPWTLADRIAIFDETGGWRVPFEPSLVPTGHPILLVHRVHLAIATAWEDRDQAVAMLRAALDRGPDRFAGFPGLAAYAVLLAAFAEGEYERAAGHNPLADGYGPLADDAGLLKARALEALGRHREATEAWIALARRGPVFNALTEAASNAVRGGRFDAFARRDWRWAVPAAARDRADCFAADEFDLVAAAFLDCAAPIRALLRQGLAYFTSDDAARRLHTDPAVTPAIRFWAAEPRLRAALLGGEYRTFLAIAAPLFSALDTDQAMPLLDQADRAIVAMYRDLIAEARRLADDPDDPKALVAVGYAIYSGHLYLPCGGAAVTLWARRHQACDSQDAAATGQPPIDMFVRALDGYERDRRRGAAEARVLRILIFCFQSLANQDYCARGHADDYPRAQRRAWFLRLHTYFSTAAAKTTYWY